MNRHSFLKYVIPVALVMLLIQPGEVSSQQATRGIYSFGLAKNFQNSGSLQLPYIAGMSAMFPWMDLEPSEGKYEFGLIHEFLDLAEKQGKKFNIILVAGNKSPEWIYQKGIPTIRWKRRYKEDQAAYNNQKIDEEKAPVFWNTLYLSCWQSLVSALAKEIRDHPALGYVNITGPTPKDYTTGTVIRFDDDWENVLEAGYTKEIHKKAWQDMVDFYVKSFPDQELIVAVGPLRPAVPDYDITKAVISHVKQHAYKQISFIAVILNDTYFVTSYGARNLRDILKAAAKDGYQFGYQVNYSVQRMSRFQNKSKKIINSMDKTLEVALSDGASWVEIWHADIIKGKGTQVNTNYQTAIEQAAGKLTQSH